MAHVKNDEPDDAEVVPPFRAAEIRAEGRPPCRPVSVDSTIKPDFARFHDRSRPAHLPAIETRNRAIIYFVTVCTNGRQPVLANDRMRAVLPDAWRQATWFSVGRYVIMPDHVHLVCAPAVWPVEAIGKWTSFWKSLSARSRKNRGGASDAERGATDDAEVVPPLATRSAGKLWQRDFWDRQLRSGESYSEKWSYVRNNPVRAGLVVTAGDWLYQGEEEVLRWHT